MSQDMDDAPAAGRKPASRRGSMRSADQRDTAAEQPSAAPPPLRTFAIRLADVVLYDLTINRNAERAEQFTAPGGNINIEVLKPLINPGRMETGLRIEVQVPGAEAPAFRVVATLNGIFDVDEGTDTALIEAFNQYTAATLVWPYARELFQSLSLRMRVLPIVLPTLDTRPPTQSVPAASDVSTSSSSHEPPTDEE